MTIQERVYEALYDIDDPEACGVDVRDLSIDLGITRAQASSALARLKLADRVFCGRWHDTSVWFRKHEERH